MPLQYANAPEPISTIPEGTTMTLTSSLSPRIPVTIVPLCCNTEQKRLEPLDSIPTQLSLGTGDESPGVTGRA